MAIRIVCRENEFHDSMVLMKINESVRQMDGVVRIAVLMGTDNNKKLLSDYGFWNQAISEANASDLLIAVEAGEDRIIDNAFARIEEMFTERASSRRGKRIYKTQESAFRAVPQANLALISVPGPFAAMEARKALQKGMNVFLFSDNLALEDELLLKRLALEKDLLVMGPDCGTAIIGGVGLGFANRVRKGEIGIVGASGTGIQEVSSLIHRFGLGISHAIGTGGRDLTKEIGGLSMLSGIDLFLDDPQTRVIVLISKPPDRQVKSLILNRVRRGNKPFVVNFLGALPDKRIEGNCHFAPTLEEAAETAVGLLKGAGRSDGNGVDDQKILQEIARLAPGQRYVRGLFSGGTLAYEAEFLLSEMISPIYSNITHNPKFRLADSRESFGHTVVDMGEDEFTRGRAHPMIDPSLLLQRLKKEARDPEVACLLLDCVLGSVAHPDPAGILSPIIEECKRESEKLGRALPTIVSVCGTEDDSQKYSTQVEKFQRVGAIVQSSNARAAKLAGVICQKRI